MILCHKVPKAPSYTKLKWHLAFLTPLMNRYKNTVLKTYYAALWCFVTWRLCGKNLWIIRVKKACLKEHSEPSSTKPAWRWKNFWDFDNRDHQTTTGRAICRLISDCRRICTPEMGSLFFFLNSTCTFMTSWMMSMTSPKVSPSAWQPWRVGQWAKYPLSSYDQQLSDIKKCPYITFIFELTAECWLLKASFRH